MQKTLSTPKKIKLFPRNITVPEKVTKIHRNINLLHTQYSKNAHKQNYQAYKDALENITYNEKNTIN